MQFGLPLKVGHIPWLQSPQCLEICRSPTPDPAVLCSLADSTFHCMDIIVIDLISLLIFVRHKKPDSVSIVFLIAHQDDVGARLKGPSATSLELGLATM